NQLYGEGLGLGREARRNKGYQYGSRQDSQNRNDAHHQGRQIGDVTGQPGCFLPPLVDIGGRKDRNKGGGQGPAQYHIYEVGNGKGHQVSIGSHGGAELGGDDLLTHKTQEPAYNADGQD